MTGQSSPSRRPGATLFTERTPRVAAARQLTRRARRDAERLFLAEGPQAVREALASPDLVTELFGTPEALERHAAMIDASPVRVSAVSDAGMASLSETVTPQGLVALCRFLDVPLEQALEPRPRLVAVLAEIRDPGNAGTVLRTADAAGARAVVFTDASVDPYNGKCVRASAGSLFHPAVVRGAGAAAAIAALRASGTKIFAADGGGERDLDDLADSDALAEPTAWVFGNEARGLPEELAALCDARVAIPIHGRAESLNLAAAAAVCLYASARAQR